MTETGDGFTTFNPRWLRGWLRLMDPKSPAGDVKMVNDHGKPCARRWRRLADEQQWPISRLVSEISECCGVTRLRAHRLARGWTLTQAVQQFHNLCAAEQLAGPRLDADQLRTWETNPERRPQPSTIDLLCRLYQSNPIDLGIDVPCDYTPAAQRTMTAPTRTRESPGDQPQRNSPDWLDSVRLSVDRTLAAGTVTAGQLDLLDERLFVHRQQYLLLPPQLMLSELVADIQEVRVLAADRQPAVVQLRLSEMTAILATLIADALMKLGCLRHASAWYATACTAADDSGKRDLRARVRIQAAMLPYYYGPLESALRLAQEARLLAQNRPTITGSFAAAAEGRIRARHGDATGAEQAMHLARDLFARAERPPVDDAWSFPERRLLLYLSGTLTYLGQTRRARAAQTQAHALYRDQSGSIDPTLLRIEEAICLAHERHLADACQLAVEAYLAVPSQHRTQILDARARNVIEAVPKRMRASRCARELNEILALPSPEM
ncbi:hypothetical protein [Streptantibioticus ferralitis]|uniref:HTH cro/C1-type domain-containing protein n=1 Tax=Streptantibioticus ferralitis TaxID=236510 RepID=A0ABT5Z1G2_9ACTN|nr:hypothetical protein [Streptantibioticus ferralitis]MDF2257665.1 hypothetical protein [Streptantibioticus ferralitis]